MLHWLYLAGLTGTLESAKITSDGNLDSISFRETCQNKPQAIRRTWGSKCESWEKKLYVNSVFEKYLE